MKSNTKLQSRTHNERKDWLSSKEMLKSSEVLRAKINNLLLSAKDIQDQNEQLIAKDEIIKNQII